MDLIIGQVLVIFILLIGLAHITGGKDWSAKVARWPLKKVAGKKARKFYWRLVKRAGKKLMAFLRWGWKKITS